ncbi:33087_t:CDS:2, partial [Gigaspora margarita]
NPEEKQKDQEELPKDLKEAKKEPEDNYSKNIEKKELPEDSKEAENEPEDNNFIFSIASSSSLLDDNDNSEKETDENDE